MEDISGTAPLSAVEPAPASAPAPTAEPQAHDNGPASQPVHEGEGKAATPAATTPDAAQERFLTLDDVPDEHRPYVEGLLKEREKQMMAAYTKKTQALSQERQKIDAYNAIEKDPQGALQRMAGFLGYEVVPKNGQQAQTLQNGMVDTSTWEPQTWQEVIERTKQETAKDIIEQLKPYLQPLYETAEQVKSQGLEHQLTQIDENWRIYEDDIKQNMAYIKPDLLKTPEGIKKLYRMSVPEEVFSSRATQAALKQYEAKVKAAQVGGTSQKNKTAPSVGKINSFNDAVMAAKRLHNLI